MNTQVNNFIKKEDIKKISKIILKLNYNPTQKNTGTIFFPLESSQTIDDSGFELKIREESGSKGGIKPGLIIAKNSNGDNEICVGYADISWAYELNIKDFIELTNSKIGKGDIETLSGYDCLLVQSGNLIGMFSI